MEDQDRYERIEKRIEAFEKRIEDLAEKLGQRVEEKIGENLDNAEVTFKRKFELNDSCNRGNSGRIFWGLAFVAAGTIWLGNQVGWFDIDVPLGAAAIILIGLYMIVSSRRR